MDWGLGNPNKTAALIAMLMVAVWGLACFRKWGFWAALTLFTGLGICRGDFLRAAPVAMEKNCRRGRIRLDYGRMFHLSASQRAI